MKPRRGARALVTACLAVVGLAVVCAPLLPQAPAPKAKVEPIAPRTRRGIREKSRAAGPSRTTTPARVEPEVRDREDAEFAMVMPRGWGPTPLPAAAAAFTDHRRPGRSLAIYLKSEAKAIPVTEALVLFYREMKSRPGVKVRWRECRPIGGRPALDCEFSREGRIERNLLLARETGRRGRFYFHMEASMPSAATTAGPSDVDRMFASFRLVGDDKPAPRPVPSVAASRPATAASPVPSPAPSARPAAPADDEDEDESEEPSPKSTAAARATTPTTVPGTSLALQPERPVVYATNATPPTTDESQLASLMVTAAMETGPGGLQRKIRNVLAFGDIERAALLARVWPRATELVVASLDPTGPEARTMLTIRQRELAEVARRVARDANKRFPAQVVGLEHLLHPGQPGFVDGTADGLHRYRGIDARVSNWMVEHAREVFRDRLTPLSWHLTAHPAQGPEWEETRLVPRAVIQEVDPRTGTLDLRTRSLDDVLARNRWASPRPTSKTALRDAALAYTRCIAALRGGSPVAGALGAARHVVAAAAAADAARLTTHTPDDQAALAFYGVLAETPDLKVAVRKAGPALAAAGTPLVEEDALATALLTRPMAERLVRDALRHALAVRLEDVERPRQTPDTTAVMLLETAAARAGDAWDRQVARKLITMQGELAEGPAKRALLAHGLERVTEAMDVELVEDLAWIPAGERERLLRELPNAERVRELLPLVRLVAREDPLLSATARWLDRRVKLLASGAAARVAAGRWGRHVPATGVSFAALAIWGRVSEVASVITTADPGRDASAAGAVARAFTGAVTRARVGRRWLDEAGDTVLGSTTDERDSIFASLRPAQDLANELENRTGPTTSAVDVYAGPWLDDADPRSVFQKLRWTPQTLAQDIGALSVAATSRSTGAGFDPAVEHAFGSYTELASLPEARRDAVRERVLGALTTAVERSRGYLQRLEQAGKKDLRRRDRLVASELRSAVSGLATAISLFWSCAAVNRALDLMDPRPPKVR